MIERLKGVIITRLIENRAPLQRFLIIFSAFSFLYLVGWTIGISKEDIAKAGLSSKTEILAIAAYFGFIMSWASAYACAYQFPSGSQILYIGILISSMLFTIVMFILPDSYLHIEGFSIQNIAIVAFVMSPGLSIMMLGFLVLFLQFFKFALKQIFLAEIKKYTGKEKLEHQ